MKDQIEKLKLELREFIKLSKTVTQGKWTQSDGGDIVYRQPMQFGQAAGMIIHGRNSGVTREQDERDAAFITRSRNISPVMAECLLVAVETLDAISLSDSSADDAHACNHPSDAFEKLQQILTIWEAAK